METACACSSMQRIPSWTQLSASAAPSPRHHGGSRAHLSSCSNAKVFEEKPSHRLNTQAQGKQEQKHTLQPSSILTGSSIRHLPHQGSCLIQAPFSPAAISTSAPGRPPSYPLVQAVFQYLSFPSFWTFWKSSAPQSGANNALSANSSTASQAPVSGVTFSGSSSLAPTGSGVQGSSEKFAGPSNSSSSLTSAASATAAAASVTVAAAVVASEMAQAACCPPPSGFGGFRGDRVNSDSSNPEVGDSQANLSQEVQGETRRPRPWFISFLVNYSLVVSAWWQFKHTAPQAMQHWLHHTLPDLIPQLQLQVPHLLPLPHLPPMPHLPQLALSLGSPSLPLPLLSFTMTLPFNPLLGHALSPAAFLRGLRPPWVSRSPAPELPPAGTQPLADDGASETEKVLEGKGWGAYTPLDEEGGKLGLEEGDGEGGGSEDERVELVVEDGMEPGLLWGQRHKDVEAEALRGSGLAPLGLSFSAAGLLFTYHLGVTQCLIDAGILTDSVPLAGASAGAIVCATIASGVDMREAVEATKVLAADCRAKGTAFRLGAVLRSILEELLPPNVHELCSGRVRVAVTQVFGQPRGLLVDQFDSKEDLINALYTSSFIPGYMAPYPITRFRSRICVDGGLTLFIPPTAAHNTVRACAFPATSLGLSNVAISPDFRGKAGRSMRQLFEWALEPAEDHELDFLFEEGYNDAQAWLSSISDGQQQQLILPGSQNLVVPEASWSVSVKA